MLWGRGKNRWSDRRINVGEDFELVGTAHVVAIARRSVRNDATGRTLPDLSGLERLDHSVLRRHAADPGVRFDTQVNYSTTIFGNLLL